MKKLSLALLSGIIITGCISDLNFNPNTDLTYKGHWAAPIINTRLSLGNLVANQDLATADADGLVHIIYREDSVFQQSVYDYTTVPVQDPISTPFSVGSPPISINTNLGTFGGAKMKAISLESGKLFWSVTSPVSDTIEIQLTLLNTTLNGQSAIFTIQAEGIGVTTGEINLGTLSLDLTQGSPAYNNLGFQLEMTQSGNAPNGTQLDIMLEYEDLRIAEAVGFFGERKINFPSGNLKTNLGLLENISTGLYLANPKVKIITRSNIGLPLEIEPSMIGVGKDGNFVDLGLNPLQFTGSTTIGNFVYDTLSISTSNSNIDEFIAAVPKEIIYSGSVKTNPAGEPQTDNFITSDGLLNVGLEIDLPLELKTKDLTIQNTIYNIDFGVEDGDVDFVEEMSLGFRVENGFPLEADLHIYFQDSIGTIIDSAFIAMFDAAQVDANGNVVTPAKSDRFLTFTNSQISNILKSDDIRIKVVLNTSNGGSQIVRLLTSNYIDLIIGARVKLNYNL